MKKYQPDFNKDCGMRITGGILKGIDLKTPKGLEFRPTLEKIRQAVFNMIQFEIDGASFLDLYAGSGAVGLEAASRGANSVFLIEREALHCKILKANLEIVQHGFSKNNFVSEVSFIQKDVNEALKDLGRAAKVFDFIWCDPPYEILKEELKKNGSLLYKIARDESTQLIIESAQKENIQVVAPTLLPGWIFKKEKIYGDTKLSFFVLA